MGVVPVRSLNQVLALPRCLEQSRKHHPYILGQEAEDSLAGPETSSEAIGASGVIFVRT